MCLLDCDIALWVKSLAAKSYNLRWIKPQDPHGGRSQSLKFSSTHVYSYNTYYRMPTYLYIHIYTFKIQRYLISPTLNWFCTVHSSLFRDTGRIERCLCDGQPVQTTFTLHDWYSLYSIHVSSTNLSFVQYPRQQKLRLSTVCAETLHVVYLHPQMPQLCSICTTTPCLLALCPGHIWHLVSLDQECQPGLCHMLHA